MFLIHQQQNYSGSDHAYRYSTEEVRLLSFDGWPCHARGTKPPLLARAVLFFAGKKDTVQWFSCSGCLGNWKDGDDSWREHALWFAEGGGGVQCFKGRLHEQEEGEDPMKHAKWFPEGQSIL
ncbi:LOW QUALITY PROTEIN: baculoviral IAP repeat-containing protein 1 [Porphyrio hochstetteri]